MPTTELHCIYCLNDDDEDEDGDDVNVEIYLCRPRSLTVRSDSGQQIIMDFTTFSPMPNPDLFKQPDGCKCIGGRAVKRALPLDFVTKIKMI